MDIIDILVPVIVFVVWLVGQIGSALVNKDQKDEDQGSRPYTPLDHPANDDEARTREIQDEIRRKIAERRGESSPGQSHEAPSSDWGQEPAAEAPPPLPRQRERDSYDSTWNEEPAYSPEPAQHPVPPRYEFPAPGRDFEAELAEQQRRREEAERRAEQARQKAKDQVSHALGASVGQHASRRANRGYSGASLARRVRNQLADPRSAREAILYQEILGTPIGQRRPGEARTSWER